VGEGDVLFHGGAELREIEFSKHEAQRRDLCETSDVFVLYRAFSWSFSLRVFGEKAPVVFLQIGIAVRSGGEHEVDVVSEPFVGIVSAVELAEADEFGGELEVQGVVPGFEELVVVDAALAPVLRLIVEDLAFLVRSGVLGSPEDGAGVRILRREV
jgi:hypothetical protein